MMNTTNVVDRYSRELEEQDRFSGVVLITQGGSHLYAGAYGYASHSWKIRNMLDMRFDTASITKLFTSVATLQMIHSDFFRMDRAHENVAEGCDPIRDEDGHVVGWKKNIYSFPPIGSPDSGAHVTARDLDRFLRAVKAGDLLSPELTGAFLTPQVPYREEDGWTMMHGYGLWFYVDKSDGVICYPKGRHQRRRQRSHSPFSSTGH
jgi:CubicO group peptidase (beta-lactamase class C family)